MAIWITALVAIQLLCRAFSVHRGPEEFTCKVEQPGYHILGKAACGLKIWKSSKRGEPLILNYTTSSGTCSYKGGMPGDVFKDICNAVGIKKPENYQPLPAFFTSQGHKLVKNEQIRENFDAGNAVFLLEGGQFQWPPVEVGFRNVVEGVEVNGKPVELETLALVPPIFKVYNLASQEEATAIIEHAKPHFVKSQVVYMDKDKGKDVDEFRTSLNYRPPHNATPLLADMEARAAQTTRMPFSHFEPVQILYYDKGGYYHAHDDASQLQFYMKDSPQLMRKHYGYFDRMLTLFWYMNDVPKGGETNFPRAGGSDGLPLQAPYDNRKCYQGLMVKPIVGQAVLWYNMHAHGLTTNYALHSACAVEEGEKYAINVWIYNKPFETPPADWDPNHPRMRRLEELSGVRAGVANSAQRTIQIENKGQSTLRIYWKGNQGLQLMADALEPGRQMNLQTFVGHTFVAKNGDIEVTSCTITADGGQTQSCTVGDASEL